MSQTINKLTGGRRIEPYWYLIAVLLVIGAALFIYHQVTGTTPDRVAIHISSFNFNIFWYGVIIVGGIALGAYVTSRVAAQRAEWVFEEHVPKSLRSRSISYQNYPKEISNNFKKKGVTTLGKLLFEWGLDPRRLGLNKEGSDEVKQKLLKHPKIKTAWLDDAPWRQWNPDYVWSGVAWCLALAVIGARLYHVLTPSPSMAAVGINSAADYFRNPLELVNLRNGGLGIYGALLGGALGLIIFSKRHRISAIAWADLAVIGLALGQSVGRWANFINQELYGQPTELPWGITIEHVHRLPGFTNFSTFHPTFLYASIWSLLTFAALLWLSRNKREWLLTGDLLSIYLILFSIGRIFTELFRLDSRSIQIPGLGLELPVATSISLLVILVMSIFLIWRHKLRRSSSK